jgi:hypothetical protein
MKKILAGQMFIPEGDAKRAVRRWFRPQQTEIYNSGISKPVVQWDKCLNRVGDRVKISYRYLQHCLYFDFPVCVLLWLKKVGAKTFPFDLVYREIKE